MAGYSETDKKWFIDLVHQSQKRLVRYSKRIVGEIESAREIVQNSYLKLWRDGFSDKREFINSWLFLVTRNESLDYLRKRKNLTEFNEELIMGDFTMNESLIEKNEIFSAISKLPKNQQEVILLKFQEGFSYKEIAKITKHSESNVGYLIHTAIKTLKESVIEAEVKK